MKTNILQITVFLLFFAGSFASCKELEENYPKEIPFTEYSLAGTSCQWANFEYSKVMVINSNEELENYISCNTGVSYPEIDFSINTLLLTRGVSPSPPKKIEKQLQRTSVTEYILSVDITMSMEMMPGAWLISLKVPKIPKDAIVQLNKNQHH